MARRVNGVNIHIFNVILLIIMAALPLVGCAPKEENITFTARVEAAEPGTLQVVTQDDVGFDRAVVFLPDPEADYTHLVGRRVRITILPQIRDSYPVQVTAVSFEVAEE